MDTAINPLNKWGQIIAWQMKLSIIIILLLFYQKKREKEMCAAFCRHIIIIFPFSSNLERENASVCLNFFLEAVLSLVIIIIEEQVEYKEHRH